MANKITTQIGFETSGGVRSLSQLRSEVKNTEGALNKMKVGAKGVGDFFKANIVEGALAAGAALAAFAAKSAKAFQDTALEAKNLSTLTGDTVEASSRLNAIWKQSGADAKDLQDVLLQMNGVLSTNKELVKELGINLNDGATVGQRFEQVADILDGVEDSAKRSQLASQLFGEEGVRQYNALRNAVGDVGNAMAQVSDAQAIDDDEVRKAERMRGAMKELEKALADIQLIVGEELAPRLVEAVDLFKDLSKAADELGDIPGLIEVAQALEAVLSPLTFLTSQYGDFKKAVDDLIPSESKLSDGFADTTKTAIAAAYATAELNAELDAYDGAADRAAARVERFAEESESAASAQDIIAHAIAEANEQFDRQQEAAQDARDALRDHADAVYGLYDAETALASSIEDANELMAEIAKGEFEGSQYDARDAVIEVAKAADDQARALLESKNMTMESEAGLRTWITSMLNTASTLSGPLRQEILNHVSRVSGIPTDVLTKFDVDMDYGALAKIQADLDAAARTRFVRFSPTGTAGGAIVDGPDTGPRSGGPRAIGGPTQPGVMYPILERGESELLTEGGRSYLLSAQNGQVTPLGKGNGSADAGNVYVTINALNGPEVERAVANALQRYNKRNGR